MPSIDRPGTAEVGRQYGVKAGLPTFLFDCGKGAAVVLVGKAIGLDDIIMAIVIFLIIVSKGIILHFVYRKISTANKF